jgi:transcriptional regulator with XRE-family HTH domain
MELITAGQLRAARGLLGWSQKELAMASQVSRATIADFEAGKRQPYARTLADLQRSLEFAGVDFVTGDELGVKMKRSGLATPRIGESATAPTGLDSQLRAAARPASPARYGRRSTDHAEVAISPEQVKSARELLGWSQGELAGKMGVSETAVSLFEREKRRLLVLDVSVLRGALEAAGVEFTNDGEPGVRLKSEHIAMPLEKFLSELDAYEQHRLRPRGVSAGGRGGVKFGFALLYTDRAAAGLMREGKELGRVRWANGAVEFDPPIAPSSPARAFEDDLDLWASAAYARSLPTTERVPDL